MFYTYDLIIYTILSVGSIILIFFMNEDNLQKLKIKEADKGEKCYNYVIGSVGFYVLNVFNDILGFVMLNPCSWNVFTLFDVLRLTANLLWAVIGMSSCWNKGSYQIGELDKIIDYMIWIAMVLSLLIFMLCQFCYCCNHQLIMIRQSDLPVNKKARQL